jgi:predicted MFS family arabinose efflux permease
MVITTSAVEDACRGPVLAAPCVTQPGGRSASASRWGAASLTPFGVLAAACPLPLRLRKDTALPRSSTLVSTAPTGSERTRLPWGPLLVLAAVGFVSVVTELLPAGLLPQIGADFGVSESRTGLMMAGYAAIIVLTVVPVMTATARLPRRTLLLTAIVAFAASNLVVALSPSFPMALAGRLVGGTAHGMAWSLMAPYVARLVPEERVGRSMAIVLGGPSLAAAAGAPLATILGGAVGWRVAFAVLAVVVLVLAVAVRLVVPPASGATTSGSSSILGAGRRPGVPLIACAWPLLAVAHFALLTYIAPVLADAGLPGFATSLSLSALGVAGLGGIWLAGRTVDSVPRRSLLGTIAAWVLSVVALTMLAPHLSAALLLVAVWGASITAATIYNQVALLRAAGPLKDPAMTLIVLATQVGVGAGSLYGGLALDTMGPRVVPLAAAVPAALALVIVVRAREVAYPPGPLER